MKLETFFESFECLTDAPNAVAKLREIVLQLAVSGKLVSQKHDDEAASFLLERIRKQRNLMIKEKKISKSRYENFESISNKMPYSLPSTWKWLRLSEVGHDWGQKKPDLEFTYIDVSAINKEQGFISENLNILQPAEAPSRARKIVKKGTVIYSTVRPYLLNIAIVNRDFQPEPIVSTAFAIIHPFEGISNKFIYYYLRSKPFIDYVESQMLGMAYPAINDSNLFKGLVPLPPLAEQKRIVEKCDRLLILCDEIEKRQQQRQESLLKMNEGAISQLLSAQNPDDFHHHWQSICNNFDLLYSIPETVPKLRQAILQLAVQGRLVPQNLMDEPASQLLVSMKSEKEKLVQNKQIKTDKPLPKLERDTLLFELPPAWEWCYISDISTKVTDGEHLTPQRSSSGYYLLSARNVRDGGISLDDVDYVPKDEFLRIRKRCDPNQGDILISCSGSVGRIAVVDRDETYVMVRSAALVKPLQNYVSSEFLAYSLRSVLVQNQITEKSRASAQANLFIGRIKELIIPLPPLAEQKRIVAKVNSLLSLCDTLEAKLKAARDSNAVLMEVAARRILVS